MTGDNEMLKVVNNKLTTNENTMWYEEPSAPKAQYWADARFIPSTPPTLENEQSYNVQIGTELTPVITYHSGVELSADPNFRVFTSPLLKNVIFTGEYYVDLFDAEGRNIPFGLNKLSIQKDAIVFAERFPQGFALPLYANFYTYTGHTDEVYLRSDGSTPMAEGYTPTEDQDIVTKKYLFDKYGPAVKIEPRKPSTIDKATLYSEDLKKTATSVLTNEECNFLFDNESVTLKSTPFYNVGKGVVYLTCNDYDIASFSMKDLADGVYDGILNVKQIDPYENSLLSFGYYKSIIVETTIDVQKIMMYVDNINSYAKFRLEYRYNAERLSTNEVVYGIAPAQKPMKIEKLKISNINDVVQKYISGVPTLKEGSTFYVTGQIIGIRKFKNPLLAKYDCSFYEEKVINNNPTYTTNFPVYELTAECKVPENYFGIFHFGARAFDILREQQAVKAFWHNFYIDTVSVEDRVTSGTGEFPLSFGKQYPHEESLCDNKELQLKNGVYQFPNGDYRDINPDLGLETELAKGPYYDGIDLSEVRWATFKFESKEYCSGVFINIEDFKAKHNDIGLLDDVHIYVKTPITGWLDANSPYNGVSVPKEDGDAAFVVANSTYDKRYVTFGTQMINGPFFVRIGFSSNGTEFKCVKLQTN